MPDIASEILVCEDRKKQRGISLVVECEPSKFDAPVRSRYPAQIVFVAEREALVRYLI